MVSENKKNSTYLKGFSKNEWEILLNNIDFTDDERKIITYIRRGWRQIDIAQELYVNESTIKRRYKSILTKITLYIHFDGIIFSDLILKTLKVIN